VINRTHTRVPGPRPLGRIFLLLVNSWIAASMAGCAGTVGLPSGNSGSADTLPPAISGVIANPGSTNAVISWSTNEAADSQVDYGTTSSYGQSTALSTALVAAHSLSLRSLTVSTLYHYRVKSRDAAGNLATGADATFTTLATPDTTPPVISGVAPTGISPTGATIRWTTDETSDSQVEYGTTASYGQSTAINSSLTTSHSLAIGGLTASTQYHYRVKSKDVAGNLASSGDFTFTTTASPDATPPVISAVTSSSVTWASATITWTTDEPADSQTDYGTSTA
jgi:phosphodiesterase/alkaline phosphatase D-like protein